MSDSCPMCDAFRLHREQLGAAHVALERCCFFDSCHGATPQEKLMHADNWQQVSVCRLLHDDGRLKLNFEFDFKYFSDADDVDTFRLTLRHRGNQRRKAIMDQRARRKR